MGSKEPTVRSRELGDGLRHVMQRAGLTGKQAAHLLGWSPSWVSRLLSGKRAATALDVAAFLGVCRVKGPERERLLALCQEQHIPGWLQQHGSRLPEQLVTLIEHENNAVTISDFEAIFVPGLLQTGEYARAVISRNVNVPPTRWTTGWQPGWPGRACSAGITHPGSPSTCTSRCYAPRWVAGR